MIATKVSKFQPFEANPRRTNADVPSPALLLLNQPLLFSLSSHHVLCTPHLLDVHARMILHPSTHRIDGKLGTQDSQRSAAAADRSVGDVPLKPLHSRRQAEHRPATYQPARASVSHNPVVMRVKQLIRSFRAGCLRGRLLWTTARSTAVAGR